MSCLVVKKKGRPHTAVYFSREDWPEFCAGSVLCEFGSGSYDDYEHENYSWNEAIGEAQASRAAAKTIVQWAMENSAVLVIGDLVSGAGTVYIVNPLPKRWVSGQVGLHTQPQNQNRTKIQTPEIW